MTPGPTSRPMHLPWRLLLPLLLVLAALLAALVAGHGLLPAPLLALALLLCSASALLAGAAWGRQRQIDRLHDARQQAQQLAQLVDVWTWQTDADHRLVRLQPPQGAPASAWVGGADGFGGDALWQRFDDSAHSLQPRMQAQQPLGELRVWQAQPGGAMARPWRLRGLPRLDGSGRFAGYTGVAWPVDGEARSATACQALDALLDDGAPVLCLAAADDDGGWRLQRASPGACRLLGLRPDQAGGSGALPWTQALASLPEALRGPVQALQPGGRIEAAGWLVQLHALGDGEPRHLLLSLASTEAAGDGATQALAAEHAAFSYTISHDLRAPIRVVEGFGRILKEDYGAQLDRVGRDHIDRVMAAAARMNHMIDALLSLSKLSTQPLQRQPVNLSQLAGFVVDELRRAQPDRQVEVHIAPGMVAQGDPTLLRMALENLLGNAWKYSAKVAHAVVRFEPELQDGRPGYLVSDNGAGFDMRFADRLFGVFQRLHSSSDFQGTGVGLASVQRIVRRHGGEIWAESEVGHGARFHFRLK
ncbi:MAG TPA: ATP-binding protein [Aquabacterium sp.]|nr:ATP-binding protein [Aquabacterium sp.]